MAVTFVETPTSWLQTAGLVPVAVTVAAEAGDIVTKVEAVASNAATRNLFNLTA